jgi:hypothetical protein
MYLTLGLMFGTIFADLFIFVLLRFLNELLEWNGDVGDLIFFVVLGSIPIVGVGFALHFWLLVPSLWLIAVIPAASLALIAAGTFLIWLCTRGLVILDRFVVRQGRKLRQRLQDYYGDQDA